MKDFIKDFLHFEKLITPKFIQYIYWLMLLSIVVGGIGVMFASYYGFTFKSF